MPKLILMLASPSASVYIFFSGIFTSIATNLLTGDSKSSASEYVLFGAGSFTVNQLQFSRIICLLVIGASLFWIGYLREDATRKADFVRGDLTTEIEYMIVVQSILNRNRKSLFLAFFILLIAIAGTVNISYLI